MKQIAHVGRLSVFEDSPFSLQPIKIKLVEEFLCSLIKCWSKEQMEKEANPSDFKFTALSFKKFPCVRCRLRTLSPLSCTSSLTRHFLSGALLLKSGSGINPYLLGPKRASSEIENQHVTFSRFAVLQTCSMIHHNHLLCCLVQCQVSGCCL